MNNTQTALVKSICLLVKQSVKSHDGCVVCMLFNRRLENHLAAAEPSDNESLSDNENVPTRLHSHFKLFPP